MRIDGELYWDGGILSNTPVEVVFDDNPRRNGWSSRCTSGIRMAPEPETMWEVMNRQKDVQYSSRARGHIKRQQPAPPHAPCHRRTRQAWLPDGASARQPRSTRWRAYGCLTRMHVVRLLAPALDYEDHTKDIDFSPAGIRRRWEAGYADTMKTLESALARSGRRRSKASSCTKRAAARWSRPRGGGAIRCRSGANARRTRSIAVLLGSMRRDRMGPRAARLVVRASSSVAAM